VQIEMWKQDNWSCYLIKKQIEPSCIYHSTKYNMNNYIKLQSLTNLSRQAETHQTIISPFLTTIFIVSIFGLMLISLVRYKPNNTGLYITECKNSTKLPSSHPHFLHASWDRILTSFVRISRGCNLCLLICTSELSLP